MSIPDEVYSRNASICTFSLHVFLSTMSMFLYDIMHYTLRDVVAHKTISIPQRFIKMAVTSQESVRSCVCVLGVSIMPPCTVFL